jgi:hypothetical protein
MTRLRTEVATIRLGAQQARNLHLAAQGLLAPPRRRARKADVLAAIERMRVLQIDTIHVVARSPYLVLFSRLGAYRPQWLDELLAEGAIFECWAHEACFMSFADYALHRSRDLTSRADRWWMKHAQRMRAEHGEGMDARGARISIASTTSPNVSSRPRGRALRSPTPPNDGSRGPRVTRSSSARCVRSALRRGAGSTTTSARRAAARTRIWSRSSKPASCCA